MERTDRGEDDESMRMRAATEVSDDDGLCVASFEVKSLSLLSHTSLSLYLSLFLSSVSHFFSDKLIVDG